jgi:NAD-dependent dihydropyrimidine dehydrogenase PreA subunit
MALRKIVKIDEEKCDGCGQCVPACSEGALEIIDGKARLVSEVYCDGLGDCLGECPQEAIVIEEREADEFDLEATERHLAQRKEKEQPAQTGASADADEPFAGCPGAAARMLSRDAGACTQTTARGPSMLVNWPVQLRLVPVQAPYFDGAKLLIAADCTPFAFADFHGEFLAGRTLVVGCPKLDDVDLYRKKLAQIFLQNDIRDVEVAYMQVPCCYGLVHLVQGALQDSGKDIPLVLTKIGVKGDILEKNIVQDDGEQAR